MHTHPKSDAHGGKSVASQWRNRPFESQGLDFFFNRVTPVVGILSKRLYKVRSSPLTLYTVGQKTVPGWGQYGRDL